MIKIYLLKISDLVQLSKGECAGGGGVRLS